jgi:hypothetical protein
MAMISLLPPEIDIDGPSIGTCHRFCQFAVQNNALGWFRPAINRNNAAARKGAIGPREVAKELI